MDEWMEAVSYISWISWERKNERTKRRERTKQLLVLQPICPGHRTGWLWLCKWISTKCFTLTFTFTIEAKGEREIKMRPEQEGKRVEVWQKASASVPGVLHTRNGYTYSFTRTDTHTYTHILLLLHWNKRMSKFKPMLDPMNTEGPTNWPRTCKYVHNRRQWRSANFHWQNSLQNQQLKARKNRRRRIDECEREHTK